MRHVARWSLLITIVLTFHAQIFHHGVWLAEHATTPDPGALIRAVGFLLGMPSILAFALFSRIDESRTLEHASRQKLRDAIRASPGASLSDLCAQTGLGWGTTVYHLNRMERAGLVASVDAGRKRAFFLAEHDAKVRNATLLLGNAAKTRLLQAVQAQPQASQQELAAAARLSLSLANRYLQRLESDGLVRSTKEWRVRRYQAASGPSGPTEDTAERQKAGTPAVPFAVPPALSPRGTNAR